MILTEDKIDTLPISDYDKGLLKSLLIDLEEINHNLSLHSPNLELEWIDEHTYYSPERTDPCPDYYGMYRVWRGDDYIGVEMDLDTLDSALCLLYNFVIGNE
jgi:hypothetical protein